MYHKAVTKIVANVDIEIHSQSKSVQQQLNGGRNYNICT